MQIDKRRVVSVDDDVWGWLAMDPSI